MSPYPPDPERTTCSAAASRCMDCRRRPSIRHGFAALDSRAQIGGCDNRLGALVAVRHALRTSSQPAQPSAASLKTYFATAFSSVRAWSIWSYAYVTISVVVIFSPLRASDS